MTSALRTPPIRRRFADVSFGQVHYRQAGEGPVLLLLHAQPGSSKQLEPVIRRLAQRFSVLAPDTPGSGDSSPLPLAEPAIADFSRGILEFVESLGIEQLDVYGTHTGACLAAELALLAPQRIRRVAQDGVVTFSASEREELLARYAFPFEPDLNGTHLLRAFMFCRDQYLFFPWYAHDQAHRRDAGLPPPLPLHEWVVEVLKAATTYHLAYRAAFAYPATERLPLLTQPVLCLAAGDDPLGPGTESVARRLPGARFTGLPRMDDEGYLDALAAALEEFLEP